MQISKKDTTFATQILKQITMKEERRIYDLYVIGEPKRKCSIEVPESLIGIVNFAISHLKEEYGGEAVATYDRTEQTINIF